MSKISDDFKDLVDQCNFIHSGHTYKSFMKLHKRIKNLEQTNKDNIDAWRREHDIQLQVASTIGELTKKISEAEKLIPKWRHTTDWSFNHYYCADELEKVLKP